MIEANKNETFPITATLVDEETNSLASGKDVSYDIRTIDDLELSPPINGMLGESSVEAGVYKAEVSIPSPGVYICYSNCIGFLPGTENIVINNENIYELSKANSPHNISVIDVPRTTEDNFDNASQEYRKVPYGMTDYIVSMVKLDTDSNWNNPVTSGISYAYYKTEDDELPYKIAGPVLI